MSSMETAIAEEIFTNIPVFCGVKAQFRLDRQIVGVSRPHTTGHKYTRPAGLTRMSDQSQRPLPTQHTTNKRDEHPRP